MTQEDHVAAVPLGYRVPSRAPGKLRLEIEDGWTRVIFPAPPESLYVAAIVMAWVPVGACSIASLMFVRLLRQFGVAQVPEMRRLMIRNAVIFGAAGAWCAWEAIWFSW